VELVISAHGLKIGNEPDNPNDLNGGHKPGGLRQRLILRCAQTKKADDQTIISL
jgi:hypothetical protein